MMHQKTKIKGNKLKILFIHNDYAEPSGEEHSVDTLSDLIAENGHQIIWYRRRSSEIGNLFTRRVSAFFSGIHNPFAIRDIRKIISKEKPDLAQVQNVYPLISPSVLRMLKREGIPVVLRCPNYRIFCPNGLFYNSRGDICEKCTGRGKEIWCIRYNCMGSIMKSNAYAARNYFARMRKSFVDYTDIFLVQSEFQRKKFIDLGIPEERIEILPGIAPEIKTNSFLSSRRYISFIGRISREKGIEDFLEAASILSELEFVVAGKLSDGYSIPENIRNVTWKGFLERTWLDELYSQSAVVVVPSRWYEGFPNVITRAMMNSVPVITTRNGALPEIVENGVNGLTYEQGDVEMLVSQIRRIFENPEEALSMGTMGRIKAEKEFSADSIYKKLIGIFESLVRS